MIEAWKLLRTALMVMVGICKQLSWGRRAMISIFKKMISIFKKALGSFTSDVDTQPKIFAAIHEGEEDICDLFEN